MTLITILLGVVSDNWSSLPLHVRIILGVATLFAILIRPTILLFQWIKKIIRDKKQKKEENNLKNDELKVPFSIKISSRTKKIRWYKEMCNSHNIFFQISDLIKYEIDTNQFSFGDQERTRLFRQLMRIYLGVLSESLKKPLDYKLNLDKMTPKELSDLFSDYIQETNNRLEKKLKDNFTSEFYDLVIINQDKGFVHFIEKTKKWAILTIKDIIYQDIKMYDSTNYRKLWEIYTLLRMLLNMSLDTFPEFYESFNGDLDLIIKK